jgi:hypothetical protein
MACALCGGPILKGQWWVRSQAFVNIIDATGQLVATPVILEDGAPNKEAHYGCLLKRCPELIGVFWGEPREL